MLANFIESVVEPAPQTWFGDLGEAVDNGNHQFYTANIMYDLLLPKLLSGKLSLTGNAA